MNENANKHMFQTNPIKENNIIMQIKLSKYIFCSMNIWDFLK